MVEYMLPKHGVAVRFRSPAYIGSQPEADPPLAEILVAKRRSRRMTGPLPVPENMTKASWLEKQMNEAKEDPDEIAIAEMLANMKQVSDPKMIVSINDVPEFGKDAVTKGIVKKVGQAKMDSTVMLPIRTDNAADCNVFLIKTSIKDGAVEYTLVHSFNGDINANADGARLDDVVSLTNRESVAIGITRGSVSIVSTARELKNEGITTVKHIGVPTNRYVSAVYRPETNEILIRVGADTDATEAWVYDGF